MEDLGELFDVELPDEDVDTVGGLLAQLLGRVPLPGSEATVNTLHLLGEPGVDRRGRPRVQTLLARRLTRRSSVSQEAAEREATASTGQPGRPRGEGGTGRASGEVDKAEARKRRKSEKANAAKKAAKAGRARRAQKAAADGPSDTVARQHRLSRERQPLRSAQSGPTPEPEGRQAQTPGSEGRQAQTLSRDPPARAVRPRHRSHHTTPPTVEDRTVSR